MVYEAALNGSLLNVKLVTGAVGDDEIRGLIPEANHYHVTHPKTSEEILFEQPLDASDNKVPVYGLGALIQSPAGGCHGTLAKGESRTATARAGTYGSEKTNESEMIGYVDGRIHEMTALLVRRARLEALNLTAIRVGYKYLFVEPGQIGKAKVKEG